MELRAMNPLCKLVGHKSGWPRELEKLDDNRSIFQLTCMRCRHQWEETLPVDSDGTLEEYPKIREEPL